MSEHREFQDLVARVCAGDQDAAAELVRTFESDIRRIARCRLTDARLKCVLDSVDICQSVLANFFVRAAIGQFEIDSPQQLVKLLVTMANNKIRDHARRLKAARRDQRRMAGGGDDVLKGLANNEATPSRIVAGRELLKQVLHQLSDEERYLAEQRVLNRPWAELAIELNSSPEALRKQLARAVDRVAQELKLQDVSLAMS